VDGHSRKAYSRGEPSYSLMIRSTGIAARRPGPRINILSFTTFNRNQPKKRQCSLRNSEEHHVTTELELTSKSCAPLVYTYKEPETTLAENLVMNQM
jgi:hypothetical protein